MIDFDIKTAPIQFAKQADGAYLSTSGQFKIHKTVHTGYGSGSAPTRWWITDLSSGRVIGRLSAHPQHWPGVSDYTISLARAIERLHMVIARGVCAAFQVLVDWRRDVERTEREAAERQTRIAVAVAIFEANICAWVAKHGTNALTQTDGVRSLALHLATPGGAL
jgi:hypothetical protein